MWLVFCSESLTVFILCSHTHTLSLSLSAAFSPTGVLKGLDPIEQEINSRPGLYRTKTAALPDLSPEAFNATVRASNLSVLSSRAVVATLWALK
jgi:hypothetical protein